MSQVKGDIEQRTAQAELASAHSLQGRPPEVKPQQLILQIQPGTGLLLNFPELIRRDAILSGNRQFPGWDTVYQTVYQFRRFQQPTGFPIYLNLQGLTFREEQAILSQITLGIGCLGAEPFLCLVDPQAPHKALVIQQQESLGVPQLSALVFIRLIARTGHADEGLGAQIIHQLFQIEDAGLL